MYFTDEVKELITGEALLKDRVGLLVLGGSLAYGTNLPEKGDIDTRGFAFEPAQQLIGGIENFGTFQHVPSDTAIYSFNKFVKLMLENNPNVLELLGCLPEHYFYVSDVAQSMIDNLDKFLSKRAFHTFGGYAKMQLERMENAIAHDSLDGRKQTEHIQGSLERAMYSFNDRYHNFEQGSIAIRIEDTDATEWGTHLVLDIAMNGFPMAQVSSMLNEFNNIQRQYSKLNHRNNKKDLEHLDKHAMHIIRLLLTGDELLTTGKMVTFREKDRELLLSIRQGAFRNTDGTYNTAYYDLKAELDKQFAYSKLHTVLPDRPDMDWVRQFTFDVNKRIIAGRLDTLKIKDGFVY